MTLARLTAADVAAYALGLAGLSRDDLPVPWTDSAAVDDCARFCSHVIWGGKPGPISWVDNFKSAGDGSYVAGSDDLQPWDVLLFDWEGNGVGNHVEFMVADQGNGYVRTYGANGSDTRAAAYRLRPKRYIMGRFRPAYSAQSAPIIHTTTTPVGEVMETHIVRIVGAKPKIAPEDVYLVNPETMRKLHLLTQTQVDYWKNRGVPDPGGVQPRSVLSNFEEVGK